MQLFYLSFLSFVGVPLKEVSAEKALNVWWDVLDVNPLDLTPFAEDIVDEASKAIGREDNRGWWDDVVSAVEDAAQEVEDAAGQAVQEAENIFDEAAKVVNVREDNRGWWDDVADAWDELSKPFNADELHG